MDESLKINIMPSVYLIVSIIIISMTMPSAGVIQSLLDDNQGTHDNQNNVLEGWCNMEGAKFETLGSLYRIPKSINETTGFSSAYYYISTSVNSGLSIIMRQNFRRINKSNGDILYRTENDPQTLSDLRLVLSYGAKYYIDVDPWSASHKLKYICMNGETNYQHCHDFQANVIKNANNYNSLLAIRIMDTYYGIRFYEIYLDRDFNLYAIERSHSNTNVSILNTTKNFSGNIDLILQILDTQRNWTDLITVHNPCYRTIRHNIILVLKDCINPNVQAINNSSFKSNTNNALMKTYILSSDDLCDIISSKGIYNLIFINHPQSPIYLYDLKISRQIDDVYVTFKSNFTITYDSKECFHEMALFDAKSIDMMRHNFRDLAYDIDYKIMTNGGNENDTIKLTYLNFGKPAEKTMYKVTYRQVNREARIRYINKTKSASRWYMMFLVKFRYQHARIPNAECSSEIKFKFIRFGNNVVQKTLKSCYK